MILTQMIPVPLIIDDLHQFSIRRSLRQVLCYLQDFNIFPSDPPRNETQDLQHQRRSTRLFLSLLFLIVTLLTSYMLVDRVTKTGVFENPTLEQFSSLQQLYPQSLSCPCSQISIDYRSFINVQYTFHPICQSIFVTSQWIEYLIAASQGVVRYAEDFRWTSRFTFQGLRALCELSNKSIAANLDVFYADRYVTKTPTSRQIFELQTQAMLDHFISSTTSQFSSSLSTVQDMFQANGLMSATGTQYNIEKPQTGSSFYIGIRWYGNCSCRMSAKCIYQSNIYGNWYDNMEFMISGMFFGCSVMQALLQSSLECFFDSTCLQTFISYLSNSTTMAVTSLDQSQSNRYSINSTVETLVSNLMIENWTTHADYDKYFSACQPSQCTFLYTAMNDVLVIVTTFISLVGGSVTILKIVTPRLMKLIVRLFIYRPRNTRVMTSSSEFHLFSKKSSEDLRFRLRGPQQISEILVEHPIVSNRCFEEFQSILVDPSIN